MMLPLEMKQLFRTTELEILEKTQSRLSEHLAPESKRIKKNTKSRRAYKEKKKLKLKNQEAQLAKTVFHENHFENGKGVRDISRDIICCYMNYYEPKFYYKL